MLQDEATGEVLWSANGRDAELAFTQHNPYVRLRVTLIAGRSYRLTADCASECNNAPVVALVRPK